jgi:hypothetical protein
MVGPSRRGSPDRDPLGWLNLFSPKQRVKGNGSLQPDQIRSDMLEIGRPTPRGRRSSYQDTQKHSESLEKKLLGRPEEKSKKET